jgi:hypothetical protein
MFDLFTGRGGFIRGGLQYNLCLTCLQEGDGHEGSRSSKSVFIDTGRIFTCGMNRMSNRQLAVWDIVSTVKVCV